MSNETAEATAVEQILGQSRGAFIESPARKGGSPVLGVAALDLLSITLALLTCVYLHVGLNRSLSPSSVLGADIAGLLLFAVAGLYDQRRVIGNRSEYARIFTASSVFVILLGMVGPVLGWPNLLANQLAPIWVSLLLWVMAARSGFKRYLGFARRSGKFRSRTLILGANEEGVAVAQQLHRSGVAAADIVGFVDEQPSAKVVGSPFSVLGGPTDILKLVTDLEIQRIIVADPALLKKLLLDDELSLGLVQKAELQVAWGGFSFLTSRLELTEDAFVPLVTVIHSRISGVHLWLKAILDYVISAVVLLLLFPVLLVLYICVAVDSKGPVVYRRRVVGLRGIEFDAFKFRTMYVDGAERLTPEDVIELEAHGKLKNDPRITRVGSFIRKCSLDELPQLINVILGEMSLVGPRMVTRREMEKFGKWQHSRVTVKPGLTGLWQVSGRSDLSYEDRANLDILYIRSHTIWLDIKILLMTIPALVSGRGAY